MLWAVWWGCRSHRKGKEAANEEQWRRAGHHETGSLISAPPQARGGSSLADVTLGWAPLPLYSVCIYLHPSRVKFVRAPNRSQLQNVWKRLSAPFFLVSSLDSSVIRKNSVLLKKLTAWMQGMFYRYTLQNWHLAILSPHH